MKKFLTAILAAGILTGTNFASAEEVDGAAAAPAEINHADSIYFPKLDFYNMKPTASSVILEHFPTYQQTTEYTCGPAAALTVLRYYGNNSWDEMKIARKMKTSTKVGTNTAQMVKFFKSIGWNVRSSLDSKPLESYGAFHDFVMENLYRGRPIIVENVEWGGHWRVIIGYEDMGTASELDDVLIFMDSYDTSDHQQEGYAIQNGWRFYSMWFDYELLPKKMSNQPWLVAYPS